MQVSPQHGIIRATRKILAAAQLVASSVCLHLLSEKCLPIFASSHRITNQWNFSKIFQNNLCTHSSIHQSQQFIFRPKRSPAIAAPLIPLRRKPIRRNTTNKICPEYKDIPTKLIAYHTIRTDFLQNKTKKRRPSFQTLPVRIATIFTVDLVSQINVVTWPTISNFFKHSCSFKSK